MTRRPLFVTQGTDDFQGSVTLLVRMPGDRDYFPWGKITIAQRDTLDDCGVFDLTGPDPDEAEEQS